MITIVFEGDAEDLTPKQIKDHMKAVYEGSEWNLDVTIPLQ